MAIKKGFRLVAKGFRLVELYVINKSPKMTAFLGGTTLLYRDMKYHLLIEYRTPKSNVILQNHH